MSHTENSSLNFHLSEEVQAIKDVAAAFADNEIAPHVLHFDETQEFPHEIFKKMGELGFSSFQLCCLPNQMKISLLGLS